MLFFEFKFSANEEKRHKSYRLPVDILHTVVKARRPQNEEPKRRFWTDKKEEHS